jgi:hypothetical protein
MRDDRIQRVAEMLIVKRWGCESDFDDEPTQTFVEWPPAPPRPAIRRARGTLPPEREDELEYEVELEYERLRS